MGIIQTFFASFGVLLIAACLLIAAVWFCLMWFGTRRRAEAQMRGVLGNDCQSHGILSNIRHAFQALLLCIIGVFFVIGMGLWTLLVAPLYWAWYRLRGKPLPDTELSF